MTDQHYGDDMKQLLWEACWFGYSKGYGVEQMKSIDKRALASAFEQWWDSQYDE